MNPKKPKDFIKPTADELKVSEALVDNVVGFYWAAVRKALSDIESPSVTVTNLGTFKVRYNKISAIQKKYDNHLENLVTNKMTFNKHAIQNNAKFKLDRLTAVKAEMQEEFERKKVVAKKRKDYVDNKALEE